MLQLYVWGPAFGLPSFDGECIAATIYLNTLCPNDEWNLIPAHDTSISPTGDFPLLQDGNTSVAGFSAIVKHLSMRGLTLDLHLTARQRADSIALSTHLTTQALPLLSYHLHTSPDTYTFTTLPAISSLLPPAVRYTLPSCLHTTALARAAGGGLSYVDNAEPKQQDQPANVDRADAKLAGAGGGMSPSLLFNKKETLQDALRTEQSKMRFRVEAALEMLLEPVVGKLKGGRAHYLVAAKEEGPSSVDCLAFGYLSLLIYPRTPQNNWLTERIRQKYPAVVKYIESLQRKLLGGTAPIDAQVIMASHGNNAFFSLPWHTFPTDYPSSPTTWITPLTHILLPHLHARSLLPPSTHLYNDPSLTSRPLDQTNNERTPLWLLTTTITAVPALLTYVGYVLFQYTRREWIGWGGGEKDKRFERPLRGWGGGEMGTGIGSRMGGFGSGWGGNGGEAAHVLSALFGDGSLGL